MSTAEITTEYIHGSNPEERQRLATLNSFMNERSLREMNPLGYEDILEVGSGLGQFAREMAKAVQPFGSVVGIEKNADQIAAARQSAAQEGEGRLVDFREGDVHSMPLRSYEWGSFDIAHARFVLEHVADPQRVVDQMAAAVRPGGRIILQDTDHSLVRLSGEPANWQELWKAYLGVYHVIGCNPYAGRELVEMLHRAGVPTRRTTMILYGSCAGAKDWGLVAYNFVDMIAGAGPAIREAGLMTPEALDRAIADLRAWLRQPAAAFWFPMTWVEGVRL